MPDSNTPVAVVPTYTALQFQTKWLPRLQYNLVEEIDDVDLRELVQDMALTFPTFFGLTARYVKGALYPLRYLDQLATIPADFLIVGMQAVAAYGVDSATGGAGVNANPVYFELRADATGTVDAHLDVVATTTTKAKWVQLSSSGGLTRITFPQLQLEDKSYLLGDVVEYTFTSGFAAGETVLAEWKAASTGSQNPVPTGLDTDPTYKLLSKPAGIAGLKSVFGAVANAFTKIGDFIGYLYTQLTAYNPAFTTLVVSANAATIVAANKYVCNTILPLTAASTTLALPTTNVPNGATGICKVVQDGTGGRALVLPSASSTHLGTADVSIKTSANAITDLSWIYDGAAFHWVSKQY